MVIVVTYCLVPGWGFFKGMKTMGYFSNGSEEQDYQNRYCEKCTHWTEERGCPCWLAHELWNSEECNNDESLLHKMIPISKDGLSNERCFSFEQKKEINK
jgi:hypothetical protein